MPLPDHCPIITAPMRHAPEVHLCSVGCGTFRCFFSRSHTCQVRGSRYIFYRTVFASCVVCVLSAAVVRNSPMTCTVNTMNERDVTDVSQLSCDTKHIRQSYTGHPAHVLDDLSLTPLILVAPPSPPPMSRARVHALKGAGRGFSFYVCESL